MIDVFFQIQFKIRSRAGLTFAAASFCSAPLSYIQKFGFFSSETIRSPPPPTLYFNSYDNNGYVASLYLMSA